MVAERMLKPPNVKRSSDHIRAGATPAAVQSTSLYEYGGPRPYTGGRPCTFKHDREKTPGRPAVQGPWAAARADVPEFLRKLD